MPWAVAASVAGAVVTSSMASDNGATGANNAAADANRQQTAIAQDQWDTYKQLYKPLEEQYVSDAQGVGSIANQNKSAQKAAADVASGFAGAREQLAETPGVNPNSDAYLRQENKINLQEAATSAAGQTGARQNVQDKGRAAMTDALSLGKGLPANASTMLASGATGLRTAAQYSNQRSDQAAAGFGKMVGGITNSKGFQDWMNSSSTTPDNYNTWQSSPESSLIYSNGSLAD